MTTAHPTLLTWTASVDRHALGTEGWEVIDFAGYVLEPAWRARTPILIESEHRLSRLPAELFIDPGFEHPYTLERALHVAERLYRAPEEAGQQTSPSPVASLDAQQRRAAGAHDGVVQIIAPAGSGKTTFLIQRVRELLHAASRPGGSSARRSIGMPASSSTSACARPGFTPSRPVPSTAWA